MPETFFGGLLPFLLGDAPPADTAAGASVGLVPGPVRAVIGARAAGGVDALTEDLCGLSRC